MAATKTTTTQAEVTPTRFAQQAAYAYAGVVKDVVDLAVEAPRHLPQSPTEFGTQVRTGVDKAVAGFSSALEAKANDGRKAIDELRSQPRVEQFTTTIEPVLAQSRNARSQIKAAVTSVTKTVNAAAEGATKQFGTVTEQGKGALTSLGKLGDAATSAARGQAHNARSQVKAARTSTRKTVDAAVEAGRKMAS